MWNKVEARSMEISMEDEGSIKKRKKVLTFPKKMKKILKNLWIFGKEDPRRVIHALKVGVALTLVSLLYLMEPFFKGVGKNALWAVMTVVVVVVLEFSAGATLRKGLNRGLGTIIAGSLAFFIEWVAIHSGKILGGIFIGTAVFIIGSTITYMRFIPYIKKNYDYGMLVFLLTFNLITVSSYRVDTVIKIAHTRLYTIGVGIAICLFMSFLVFPIWSGDDLHKSTVTKLQGLSRCIEACVSEYFEENEKNKETSDSESDDEELIYNGYKTVLDSKSTDEALAMYAKWEPRHTYLTFLFATKLSKKNVVWRSTITYMRFIPYIKKNYDYGMLVFLLTFNLITVSSYRVDTVIKIAHTRLYTIGVGIAICLFMSFLVFPIWSGDDLHKSTVTKLQGLSRCIEACVSEYFEENEKNKETSDSESDDEELIYNGYKTVLDSKSTDEALAMYAKWEPRHTMHCHKFPSQQYIKVGSVLRKFSYTVVALHGCLQTEIQTPRSIRVLFKDPCVRLAGEICKVLSELSESIRNRRRCSPEILSDSLEVALKDLNSTIKSQPKLFLGSNLHGDITNTHLHGDVSYYNDATSNDIVSYHNDNNSNGCVLGQTIEENDTVSPLRLNSAVSLSSLRSVKKSAATGEKKRRLRKQMSKIAVMKSLEFSEALPFAAFASLLVEMVARLDTVIDEVEELGTIACFKEYDNTVEVRVEKPVHLLVGD